MDFDDVTRPAPQQGDVMGKALQIIYKGRMDDAVGASTAVSINLK